MAQMRYWPIVSFVSGELSPLLRGRVDIQQYRQGAQTMRNFQPLQFGGARKRHGTEHMDLVSAPDDGTRLIPFAQSRDQSFVVVLSELGIYIHDASGAEIRQTMACPWTADEIPDLDWAMADDTLVFVHPDHAPKRLARYGAESWRLDDLPFSTWPTAEVGRWVASTIWAPSSTTQPNGTIQVTGNFAESDVGRTIRRGPGLGVVSGFVNATTVNVDVQRAFSTSTEPWVLEGSPMATLTPSLVGPVGSPVALTASANVLVDASPALGVVRINGGLVQVTNVSGTAISGVILEELASTVAAPAGGWVYESPVWSDVRGWPRTVTFHDQRMLFGGWTANPQGIVASAIGLYLDFRRSSDVSDGWAYRLGSRDQNTLEYLVSDQELVVFTINAEHALFQQFDSTLTYENPPSVRRQSNHGTARVRPIELDDELIFVQRDGRRVLSMRFDGAARKYFVEDISLLAEHLFDADVVSMAFARSPVPTLWCVLANGRLVACTFDRSQSVLAWWRVDGQGDYKGVTVVPNGDHDATFFLVERPYSGYHLLERQRPLWWPRADDESAEVVGRQTGLMLDGAKLFDSGTAATVFTGLSHFGTATLRVVADGYDAGTFTQSGGSITLPYAAKRVAVGVGYTATLEPMPPELPTAQGTGQGRPAHMGRTTLKLHESIGGKIAGDPIMAAPVFASSSVVIPPAQFTGEKDAQLFGWERDEPPATIEADGPYPFHLLFYSSRASNA